jgi:hypothetical protein
LRVLDHPTGVQFFSEVGPMVAHHDCQVVLAVVMKMDRQREPVWLVVRLAADGVEDSGRDVHASLGWPLRCWWLRLRGRLTDLAQAPQDILNTSDHSPGDDSVPEQD